MPNKKTKHAAKESANAESKRLELIDATVAEIAENGLQSLTLSKIAGRANLAAGAINFYFGKKDTLLAEMLRHLVAIEEEEMNGFAAQNPTPEAALLHLFEMQLLSDFASADRVAVWHALEVAENNPPEVDAILQRLSESQENDLLEWCTAIISSCPTGTSMDPGAMAYGLFGLLDTLWYEIQTQRSKFNQAKIERTYKLYFSSVFPWAFDPPAELAANEDADADEEQLGPVSAVRCQTERDIQTLAPLMQRYLTSIGQQCTLRRTAERLKQSINEDNGVIFLAKSYDNLPAGFHRIDESPGTNGTEKIWTSGFIYTDPKFRGSDTSRKLIAATIEGAKDAGVSKLRMEVDISRERTASYFEDLGFIEKPRARMYELEL